MPRFRKAPGVQLGGSRTFRECGHPPPLSHTVSLPPSLFNPYIWKFPRKAGYSDILYTYKGKRREDQFTKHHGKWGVIVITVLFKSVCVLVVRPG